MSRPSSAMPQIRKPQTLQEALYAIRSGAEDVKRCGLPPRPRTASPLPYPADTLYVATADQQLTSSKTLPRPLTVGILNAARVAQFDELYERNVLSLSNEDIVHLSSNEVDSLYTAKCADQHCIPNFDRLNRFLRVISQQCRGQWFVMRECGMGPACCAALCRILQGNTHYTHIDLSGNDLGPSGAISLAQLVSNNSTICVLRAQSANLGAGVYNLAEALKRNVTLTALDLSGLPGIHRNSIWGPSAKALAEMLHYNSVLSWLNLASCGLQRKSASIFRACATHVALTLLNVSGNSICDRDMDALCEMFIRGTCGLETLDLSSNTITCDGVEKIATGLASGGTPARSLTSLNLANNKVGSRGCQALGSAIREHPSLSSLILDGNQLLLAGIDEEGNHKPDSQEGVDVLLKELQANEHLKTLRMCECGLVELPQSLSTMLNKNYTITKLDLSSNEFGDAGAEIIARGLHLNSSLKTLLLRGCRMSTVGGTSLAHSIRKHQCLTTLKLQHQVMLDPIASGLIDAVRANTHILDVDFAKEAYEAVRPSLVRNKFLKIHSAGPQLIEKQKELELERQTFLHTQDLIVDEQRRREKLTEQLKVIREKQKAAVISFKNELQELADQLERGTHERRKLERTSLADEDRIMNEKRRLEMQQQQLAKRVDDTVAARTRIRLQVSKLKNAASSKASLGVQELQKELEEILAETNELKKMHEIFQRRIADISQGDAQKKGLARRGTLRPKATMRKPAK